MAAFRSAVERWGADMLEMDVRATADGVVVVLHDATLDRTTDGSGSVGQHTWAEVRELDAGYHFVDPDGQPTFRGVGVRVPAFEEVLTAFPRVRLNVEIKDASADGVVDIIRRHEAERRVLVAAEHEAARHRVRGYPGPWGASAAQLRRFAVALRVPASVGKHWVPRADALQVPDVWRGRTVVTPTLLAEAHRRNLPVHVWTVDEPARMRQLVDWGIDGIQTDRPDLLLEVLHDAVGRPRPTSS